MQKESWDSVRIYYPEYSQEKLVSLLKERVKRLAAKLPLVAVVLFGSYAKGNQTVASDADVLIIYQDPKNKDDYSVSWDSFEIPILEPHVYALSEYLTLVRENSWLPREATRSGILISGELPNYVQVDRA